MERSKHSERRWRPPSLFIMLAAIMLIASQAPLAGLANEDCAACHEEVSDAFARTSHGIYLDGTPRAEHSCESCHGPGEAHAEEMDPALIINPAKIDGFNEQETCFNCHSGHEFDGWDFSGHKNGDVTCASCHTVHADAGHSMKKEGPELCYTCHAEVRGQMLMPSHHPVIEGKMECNDCHNPHGGMAEKVMFDDSRELCFSCHAEKEGPFVFEHDPVNEDCMICHTPHGSVANSLLKANEPALCLNCHSMHFHATVTGDPDEFTVPNNSDRNGVSTLDGWKKGFLTNCTSCHTAIHGTDMPSQSISGQGGALTR